MNVLPAFIYVHHVHSWCQWNSKGGTGCLKWSCRGLWGQHVGPGKWLCISMRAMRALSLWASLSLRLTFLHVCVWLHVGMGTEMKVWARVCSRAGSPRTDWSQAVVGHLAWTLGWVCTLPKSSFLNAEPDLQPLGPFVLQVLKSHLITFFSNTC